MNPTTPNKSEGAEWEREFDKQFLFLARAIDFYKGETYTNINKFGKDHLNDIKAFIAHQRQQAVAEFAREVVALCKHTETYYTTGEANKTEHDAGYELGAVSATSHVEKLVLDLLTQRGIDLTTS